MYLLQVSGYTNWAAKEPSTSSPRPDCVFLHTAKARRGTWEAGVCEMTLSYLCEAPAGRDWLITLKYN